MDAFLINISSFPTVIFSTGLVIVIGFWLLSFLGLFDLDSLDVDTDIDIDLDIESNVGGVGGIAGLLVSLGLTGVPVTLVISFLVLNSWFICYFASISVPEFPEVMSAIQIIVNVSIAIISLLVAIPITAAMIRPLRKFFRKVNQEPIARSIIGRSCRVRSSRVDNSFGEAECLSHGASLIIKVRAYGKQTFSTGDSVVVIEHQPEDDTFVVVSEKEFSEQMN